MILTTYQTRRRDQLNETKKSSSKSIGFRKKYRDILLFNRNLLISGTVGFFVSVLATQIIVEIDISSAFDISIVTILIGYCASKPLFIILFHRDNKQKYKNPMTGTTDSKILELIIKHLIVAYLVFDVVYIVSRFVIMYGLLLELKTGALEASIISSVCASSLSYLSTNVTIKISRMFKLGIR
jgi:hypothetical protein